MCTANPTRSLWLPVCCLHGMMLPESLEVTFSLQTQFVSKALQDKAAYWSISSDQGSSTMHFYKGIDFYKDILKSFIIYYLGPTLAGAWMLAIPSMSQMSLSHMLWRMDSSLVTLKEGTFNNFINKARNLIFILKVMRSCCSLRYFHWNITSENSVLVSSNMICFKLFFV